MHTSGLTNTPLTKTLLIYTLASSIALSILDIKHFAPIHVSPHFWPYGQFWRALLWQVAGFTNSTEALFAAMLVYHLRVVERAWGARKLATFLLTTFPYTTFLPPLLLTILIRPLSLTKFNYLPSGPTATIFALLAQYHLSIPHTFRYRISTSSSTPADDDATAQPTGKSLTLLFSDKSTTYLVAAQLALSQFPGMVLPAVVGWFVGLAWRMEMLPGVSARWRVPAWVVGEKERTRRVVVGPSGGEERYEDLRRRLEGEAAAAAAEASGSSSSAGQGSGIGLRQGRRI
ncbi:hypothetical protein BDV38DRAFT_31234 [Aspergillus pseudotamarii]|uniref:DSC E3 ubiquitin ligase complex subunit 2 n=1 Tax=Aspergillus pseudotamarii TaxID=132259 RepID=A0A5N6SDI8_ASPPS|nr:uncharacterized protein BDV38DRAFT_31234 [Aspergillus pseudotamarii]KAE8131164.1 hypothetical protein BDV38DRAFT_31234 [Aspergillus pseudotamarii]